MWYAVQTVFIDGKLFGSECMFEENGGGMKGCCDHPPPFRGADELMRREILQQDQDIHGLVRDPGTRTPFP